MKYLTSDQGKFTEKILSGTANQVAVTTTANGVTFSLPQSIHAAAAVTFGTMVVQGTVTAGANSGFTFYDNVTQCIFQVNGGKTFLLYSSTAMGTWWYATADGTAIGLNYTSVAGQLAVRSDSAARVTGHFLSATSPSVPVVVVDGQGTLGAAAHLLAARLNGTDKWRITKDGLPQNLTTQSGSGSAALGANCPAVTLGTPYEWEKVICSDGSVGFRPIWK